MTTKIRHMTMHWRDGIENTSFKDFYNEFGSLFIDEDEAKSVYKEVTGKDAKPKKNESKGEAQ